MTWPAWRAGSVLSISNTLEGPFVEIRAAVGAHVPSVKAVTDTAYEHHATLRELMRERSDPRSSRRASPCTGMDVGKWRPGTASTRSGRA
ncbi:hypothetical protein CLM62_03890 [Streptomyces sp. SA15]|nr:hypothetical protein CLM62_03890 [Streptomyces sp. SA15]